MTTASIISRVWSCRAASFPEQQEIVRLLDSAVVEVIERNERELDGALRQSEALRQSILKKPSPAASSLKTRPTNPPPNSSPASARNALVWRPGPRNR